MFTNADITLYSCSKDGKYTRKVINNVFWDDVKQSNVIKSGITTADSVKIKIPLESIKESLPFTLMKDLIVKGVITEEIDNTSQSTISASLSALKNKYDKVVTLSVVDEKLYGSQNMQHITLSCK